MPAMNNSGHFFCSCRGFFVPLPHNSLLKSIMSKAKLLVLMAAVMLTTGCKEKKKTDDIIATKAEVVKPSAPIRMQDYTQVKDVAWLGKQYKVTIHRTPDDSLRMVKDEMGQKFVDNRISLTVTRSDGSVAISKTFTKANFENYIDEKYRRMGILEGFVFDEVDDLRLEFAASVSLPLTDEYIPLEVKVDNFGNVTIERDSNMDTYGTGDEDDESDDD